MKLTKAGAPIFYEVNIRQYTPEGSFTAFLEHLPRLKEMGVEILWLMPIHPIGKLNRKGSLGSYYSIADFTAINPEFGTLNDFKLLVDEVHHLGMKLIIDWVANHTAWDHVWTKTNPEFYAKNEKGETFAPYDWDDVMQLDHNNEKQQQAMAAAMQFWVEECGIDGFRCDMAHLTPLSTWRTAKATCDAKKSLIWLAETEEESYYEIFDTIYGWEWLHASNAIAKGKTTIARLQLIIDKYAAAQKIGKLRLMFTTNHDENSWNGSEFERLGPYANTLTVLSWLLPGAPLIYSGQEAPLKERLPFFEKANIAWNGFKDQAFISKLIQTITDHPCFVNKTDTNFEWINHNSQGAVLSFMYHCLGKKLVIIANLSTNEINCTFNDNKLWANYYEMYSLNNKALHSKHLDMDDDVIKVNFSETLQLAPLQLSIFCN